MKTNLIVFILLGFLATALALDPPPGGGYPFQTTALGDQALLNYIPAGLGGNTALGFQALKSDTTGYLNTAVGEYALLFNTDGLWNVAVGATALEVNTSGTGNVCIGTESMVNNTTGGFNTAVGLDALHNTVDTDLNTALGYVSLFYNTGANNTALGSLALFRKIRGDYNIAIGYEAGINLKSGSNNITIGNRGREHEAGVIRIGTPANHVSAYIAGVAGVTIANGVGVIVGTDGQLGTATSSARYKENIQPMAKSSQAILSLKPVTFRYKKELDPEAIPQFGLVAEEVAKVNPDLVARDEQGKPYTVRYEAVNAMLLNEFLKARRQIDAQQKQIDALAAGLQKVSAQLEASGRAQQTLVSNP